MRLFPLMMLAILASSLLPFSTMNAYALNCESTQTGFWDQSSTWINCGGSTPTDGDSVTIKNGDIVTVRSDIVVDVRITVELGAELVIDGTNNGGDLEIKNGPLTNFGKITTIGQAVGGHPVGELRLSSADAINECSGIIETNGANGGDSGFIVVNSALFVNKGTINLNGGDGFSQSGSLQINIISQLDNHGAINENPGMADDSGIVVNEGIFNHNLPNLCAVGGEFIGVDSTALLVAGAQMNAAWMIPVIVSAIGIAIVIARKQ